MPPSQSKRDNFLQTYRSHQLFSLPDSILYYINKKPSSAKGYRKIVQSCKYFFIKNPIIVIDQLFLLNGACSVDLGNHKFTSFKNTKSQLWVADMFGVGTNWCTKDEIPKFYRIDAKTIDFSNNIIIFNFVVFLLSNVEEITLSWQAIKNDLINTLQKYHNRYTEDISVNSPISVVATNTVKQLLELSNFSNIKIFRIKFIYDTFDIEEFITHIVKKNKQIKFSLHFSCTISRTYKNRLEAIIDEVLAPNNRDYKPPMIEFYGQNKEKLFTMQSLFDQC